MHHGTILVNLDKDAAAKYLNVNKEKLKVCKTDSFCGWTNSLVFAEQRRGECAATNYEFE